MLHARDPHDVLVERVDRDRLVVPAGRVVIERIAEAARGFEPVRVREQVRRQRIGRGIAQPRAPRRAAVAGAEHRVQAVLVIADAVAVAVETVRDRRGHGVHHVRVRARVIERRTAHARFGEHHLERAGATGVVVAEDRRGAGQAEARGRQDRAGQPVAVGRGTRRAHREHAVSPVARRQHEQVVAAFVARLAVLVHGTQQPRERVAAVVRAPHAGVRRGVDAAMVDAAHHEVGHVAEVVAGSRRELLEGLAAVARTQYPLAPHRGIRLLAVAIELARARVDRVGLDRVDQERADVDVGQLAAERMPGVGAVGGFPHAAGDAAREHAVRVARVEHERARAARDVVGAERFPARRRFRLRLAVEEAARRGRIARQLRGLRPGIAQQCGVELGHAGRQSAPRLELGPLGRQVLALARWLHARRFRCARACRREQCRERRQQDPPHVPLRPEMYENQYRCGEFVRRESASRRTDAQGLQRRVATGFARA